MNEELERINKLIDQGFESIPPPDYDKVFDKMKTDIHELVEGLRWFTNRVEKGEIRSKTTYIKFKALVSRHDLIFKSEAKNGDQPVDK